MGFCDLCNIINLLRIVIGVFGGISLLISGYYYFNNFNNLDCGDLKLGVGMGITSIFTLVITTLMYCSSCVSKIFIPISACFVIGSTSYNLYLSEVIDSTCKQNYIDANMWDYFVYLVIAQVIISILGIIFIIGAYLKNRNEGISYDEL
jgi:hypothetical protein